MKKMSEQPYQQHNEWSSIERIIEEMDIPPSSLLRSAEGVVLFGAGGGVYSRSALQYLQKCGINIRCYCDNDVNKQGKTIDGVKVVSPQELLGMLDPFVIITTMLPVRAISSQLDQLQLKHISFSAYMVSERLDQYYLVYSKLLKDVRSKEVYIAVLKSMLLGSNKYCRAVMEDNQYWAIPGFMGDGHGVFVDAGAYVGDILEQFVWKNTGVFKKIYAFEPGEIQYKAMQHRVIRLIKEWALTPDKIICVCAGLGNADTMVLYECNDGALASGNLVINNGTDMNTVKLYSLDSYLGFEEVNMIKADIEGFELEMLHGAAKVIKRSRPNLAICIYHKPDDLFRIPLFIHSLVPEYQIAVRHHSNTLLDTVLYCWVEE